MESSRPSTPGAHLRRFLDAYASGEPARNVDEFGLLPSWKPLTGSVWEIRAGETRSFGWFVRANVLVLVDRGLKSKFLDSNGKELDARYQQSRRAVITWRDQQSLDQQEIDHGRDHTKLVT